MAEADRPAAIVIAKAPRPGLCKTRLEPVLGPDGCARLQRALLRRAAAWAAAARGTAAWSVEANVAPDAPMSSISVSTGVGSSCTPLA